MNLALYTLVILGTLCSKASDDVVEGDVPTFIPPKLLERKTPIYPKAALQEGIEAWVYLHFMVDAEGKVTDLNVIDSIGGSEFERAAIAALRESTYAPATKNGVPVAASRVLKSTFVLGSAPRKATSEFMNLMIRYTTHAMEETQYVLRAELATMETEARSLHEFALLAIMEGLYHRQWGTREDHLQALRRSLAYESTSSFLPDDVFVKSLEVKFLFEVDLEYYQDALSTFRKLERLKSTFNDPVKEQHARVLEIRQNRVPFTKSAKLDQAGRWNYALLWNKFSMELEKPIAKDFRVRCERESVTFKYEPHRQYVLPDSSGKCRLFVEGTPYAPIKLHQL